MTVDLAPLFIAQGSLDATIHQNHGLDYPTTLRRRILALLVELGELANETRAFKFWSLKEPSPFKKILDEYADGLHFLLSIGIAIGSKKTLYEIPEEKTSLVDAFLRNYELVAAFNENPTIDRYETAFANYLSIIPLLGATPEQAVAAYYDKLGVNYKRQQDKY